jgi:deoxyguanosine kinase
MYYNVHDALAEKIPLPDLVVYLAADTSVLMQRIAQRDRPYERSMEKSYIATLNDAYDDFFDNYFQGVPVLRIDTNDLNFVSNPEAQGFVEKEIRERLAAAPKQEKLPLEVPGD